MGGQAAGQGAKRAQALALGIVAGMRSQMPLALLAVAADRHSRFAGPGRAWDLLDSPKAPILTGLLALGEVVGDKLPATPSRLEPVPLAGRLLFGSVAGAVVVGQSRDGRWRGAALGAAGAVIGAYGGYHARAALREATGVPDPVWGAVEDVIALGLGVLALALELGLGRR
ncbi:MAG TPA: DUF4126 family protein [Thermomicrobiales bacterium]|nr:DUF4126 family protein [Thermomicrobiales bacterium]